MSTAPDSLTPGQLEIMREVWRRGECTITEIWRAVQGRREWARNTVLTLVQRLEQRGWLSSRAQGRGHVYWAAVDREEARQHHLREVVEHVFDGSAEELVRSLLGREMVDRDEIVRLRQMLEQSEKTRGGES